MVKKYSIAFLDADALMWVVLEKNCINFETFCIIHIFTPLMQML